MYWEVVIFVSALAATISASDMPVGEGMDATATGGLINKTDPIREFVASGVLIENTDFVKMSEEAIGFHNGNSLEERRGCFPTLSCTRTGGYCIRPQADCNGTVDTQGCRRGRRCKCCIPDQTTSAPLTCPTTESIHTCPAVTPCPISAIRTTDIPTTTDIATTDIPTTYVPTTYIPTTDVPTTYIPTTDIPTTSEIPTTDIPTTDIPKTDIPTTIAVTTQDPADNPNLSWLSVGSDRFVRFPRPLSWFAARSLCQANGLDLFEPKDVKAIAIYLDDNFSESWYWVGARGNGVSQIWLSGGVIPRSAPWYSSYYQYVGTDKCIHILTHSGYAKKGEVLAPIDCTHGSNVNVLCG